jgi:hypothetical protein
MAIALEKRIRKLESQAGLGRCSNPDHASVFFVAPNNKAEEEAKIDSMRSCQKCSSRQVIIFQSNVPEDEG